MYVFIKRIVNLAIPRRTLMTVAYSIGLFIIDISNDEHYLTNKDGYKVTFSRLNSYFNYLFEETHMSRWVYNTEQVRNSFFRDHTRCGLFTCRVGAQSMGRTERKRNFLTSKINLTISTNYL